MQVGFFFWPYTPELCELLAERADRYGYAMIGIADTPGNAMDPWVSAAIVARSSRRQRGRDCVPRPPRKRPRGARHRRRSQRYQERGACEIARA
jgi:hypothetical protein